MNVYKVGDLEYHHDERARRTLNKLLGGHPIRFVYRAPEMRGKQWAAKSFHLSAEECIIVLATGRVLHIGVSEWLNVNVLKE